MYFTPNREAELAYPKLRCDALHKSGAVIYTSQTKNRFHISRIGILFHPLTTTLLEELPIYLRLFVA